jgi:hypothetical protein
MMVVVIVVIRLRRIGEESKPFIALLLRCCARLWRCLTICSHFFSGNPVEMP